MESSRLRFAGLVFAFAIISGCAGRESGNRTASSSQAQASSPVSFKSADGGADLHGILSLPRGDGPYPSVVILESQLCESGFPQWAPDALNSWGYATLTVDSYAARDLGPAACSDFTSLQPVEAIGDAYRALRALAADRRIDAKRIALLGIWDGSTPTILADTVEAERTYTANGAAHFRAFFAFAPFCNFQFDGDELHPYAPERIYIGGRDDLTPAPACVAFAKSLREHGGDVSVQVYANAEHGFDYVPTANAAPPRDSTAGHPHGETFTYPVRPYYIPFQENLSACSFRMKSIFQKATRDDVKRCARKGAHVASDADAAYSARDDLKEQLAKLLTP